MSNQLPSDPPPSSVELSHTKFGVKSRSVNRRRSQSKITANPQLRLSLSWDSLSFAQRDEIYAYALEKDGNVGSFRVIVPTYSENADMEVTTANPYANVSKGLDTLRVANIGNGRLNKMNLIRISGRNEVYCVTSAADPIPGDDTNDQIITVRPRLMVDITQATVLEVKDVDVNVSIDMDTLKTQSKGMSATVSFDLVEELN